MRVPGKRISTAALALVYQQALPAVAGGREHFADLLGGAPDLSAKSWRPTVRRIRGAQESYSVVCKGHAAASSGIFQVQRFASGQPAEQGLKVREVPRAGDLRDTAELARGDILGVDVRRSPRRSGGSPVAQGEQ